MKKYILSLDQGTTSSRAILFDHEQNMVASVSREFPQIYPKEGWVEHDPIDIWSSEYGCMMEVIAKTGISADEIAAIGITNQRETTLVWDRDTGRPVMNAIVWQCRRTADRIEALKPYHGMIREKTGLVPDAYFSASKIAWILDHTEGAREAAQAGKLAFGTVDTWLIYKLTGQHATDRTNASRTMLYNINTCEWDDELLALFDIPRSMLPQVKSSSEIYGYASVNGISIPVCGVAGDQQAALFGQGCFSAGEAKNTYGTGCFLLMNTGEERVSSQNGLLTTIAATCAGEGVQYALEGSVFSGGSVIQWLRDEMRFFTDSRDAEYYASKVSDTGGVYLVPAFTGLGAPYWDMHARATITGMTRGTRREHIIRAAEEAIAYQSADLLFAMERDMGEKIHALKVDGGATRDSFLLQFQCDILDRPVLRPVIRETTALGAAYLAGLASGFWKSKEELVRAWKCDRQFDPAMDDTRRASLLDGWHKAVGQTMCKG
ncbi:MAG: glycerol kinase GlpK [Clostridia bacterium]|nr:glycerol kinase GlpK [Clostridia bacterium]